jgi:hypothetical protein
MIASPSVESQPFQSSDGGIPALFRRRAELKRHLHCEVAPG